MVEGVPIRRFASRCWGSKNHRLYDVTLDRSEAAWDSYFLRFEGDEQVRGVCMDLAEIGWHQPKASTYGFRNFENCRLRVKALCSKN